MTRVAVYGAGGFGREVRGMLDLQHDNFSFAGFIDDFKICEPQLKDDGFDDVILAIAKPAIRKKIFEAWSKREVPFASFVSPDVAMHHSVKIGNGSVICAGVKLTVDIEIGSFVIVNLNSTIGHDVSIGSFSSIMPSVNISGNVTVGEGVFIGTGATVLQGVTIGENSIIGAGSLVRENVPANSTMIGVPARKIR